MTAAMRRLLVPLSTRPRDMSIGSTRRRDMSIGGASFDTSAGWADAVDMFGLRGFVSECGVCGKAACRGAAGPVVTLREQQAEAEKLDEGIAKNLKELGYGE